MSEDEELLALVELTLIPGIGTVTQSKLRSFCGSVSDIFRMPQGELESHSVAAECCRTLRSRRYRPMAEEIVDWSRREKCVLLARGGPGYPALLGETYDPPLLLYARGSVELLARPSVAVVGTRRPTPYGLQMAEGIASDLAVRGVVVVSGLARGIDAASHRGCLDGGGQTIAVLGNGIDRVYPREHRRLSAEIERRGLLLSEFPPGTSPAPQNFPVRNRIISGIALGTLIIEASEYSGSLITARLAMEQNREVYALPGNLTSPQSFGPNFLIKQGAKLVQSWRDVVEEFPTDLRHDILAKEEGRSPEAPLLELLGDDERSLLDLLEFDRATLFDKILRGSGLESPHLCKLLLDLEMRGFVRQLPGNLFVRCARPRAKV